MSEENELKPTRRRIRQLGRVSREREEAI